MKILQILFFYVVLSIPLLGQNLVPNGDFSQMVEPPDFHMGILHKCFEHWFSPAEDGRFPGPISYKINELGYTGVPNTPPRYYPSPTVDSSYCTLTSWGQLTLGENNRSYLSTRLIENVIQGDFYRFSMDFCFFSNSSQYSNNLGVAFTDSLSTSVRELISVPVEFNIDTPVTTGFT